ncbi:HEAT repeat domain-containing protein [Mycolicibacterium sp. XJ2546]
MTEMNGVPVFGYPLLIARNFDDVLKRHGAPYPLVELRSLMQRTGRMLLQARGGAGKTKTAERLAALEPESSGVAFVAARSLPAGLEGATAAFNIELLVSLSADPRRASLLRDHGEGLVVIDGINEILKDRAADILMAIPRLAAHYPFIRILVTDRLTRRDIDQTEWVLATLGPVPAQEALDRLGKETGELPDHLTIPYYLDQSIREAGTRSQGETSQVEILRRGITVHGGVPNSALESLARAVYTSYEAYGERAIGSEDILSAVGIEVFRKMLDSGLLVGGNDRAQFDHHLHQDFLAALHLGADKSLWNSNGFDTLTLRASSFDALALAAALIERQAVDDFVHRVFDWNYYGAAYLLEEDQAGDKRIWDAMRIAILAMLAEKRFDRMAVTAHRVEDALRLQETALAPLLLAATDRAAVVDIIDAALPENWAATWPRWFQDWYEMFKRPSGSSATADDINDLTSAIGTVGWANSNMLKRLNISHDLRRRVGEYATGHPDPTVRWRAVHALGAWPTDSTLELLLGRVQDSAEQLWVRYGALRSLLEVAAEGSVEVRGRVFDALGDAEVATVIAREPNLRREAIRALEVSAMPEDWHALAGDFMEHLWAESDDPLDREAVLLLAQRLRTSRAVGA